MTFPYNLVPRTRSLRLRLLLASVVVEVVMLSLLVANGVRLVETHLLRNTELRVEIQEASYNITLAGFLASRDYGGLQSVLDGWGASKSIIYMVVTDPATNRVLAATGRPKGMPLPSEDAAVAADAEVYNGEFEVTYLGQRYGHVHYGMDTAFLAVARNELIRQSLIIAATEVLLTAALLATIGYWLTRHLTILTRASLRVAKGDFSQRIEIDRDDEVGMLSQAFNTMSAAVAGRILELEASQERFRAIADYTHAWENWFDCQGRLRWVNPAVERICGYPPEACYDMDGFPLPIVEPDDRAEVKSCLTAALAGEWGQDVEFRVIRRDGEIIWVAMSWQPIFDRAGKPLGVRASIRDVTEKKLSVEAMLDSRNELERLLHAASHDLQEPVRVVQIYTQVLERDLGGELSEQARKSLEVIRQETVQLRHLVKGLVDFSHSGRSRASFGPVDCRTVVGLAIADCEAEGGEASFEIGDLPVVFGDASLLRILFENIISNAVKFHRAGTAAMVRVGATVDDGGWRIDVADNGIGIAPEDLQTITRPFSRVYSRAEFPGAGLGLASASKVATLHGGRLWLDSTPGQGTIVHIWLPPFGN